MARQTRITKLQVHLASGEVISREFKPEDYAFIRRSRNWFYNKFTPKETWIEVEVRWSEEHIKLPAEITPADFELAP